MTQDKATPKSLSSGSAERSTQDLRAAVSGPLARKLSPKYLEQHCILPLEIRDGTLIVAAGAPLDPTTLDELSWTFDSRVRVIEASSAEIHAAIMSAAGDGLSSQAADLRGADVEVVAEEEEAFDDVRALADQAPVIKLVNVMILEALKARASDLHLESTPRGFASGTVSTAFSTTFPGHPAPTRPPRSAASRSWPT